MDSSLAKHYLLTHLIHFFFRERERKVTCEKNIFLLGFFCMPFVLVGSLPPRWVSFDLPEFATFGGWVTGQLWPIGSVVLHGCWCVCRFLVGPLSLGSRRRPRLVSSDSLESFASNGPAPGQFWVVGRVIFLGWYHACVIDLVGPLPLGDWQPSMGTIRFTIIFYFRWSCSWEV